MTNDELILAISWKIATEPKLYWQLAPNPYTPQALQIIAERFPDTNPDDVIKAVVLAEPEGVYDRVSDKAITRPQEAKLKRLVQYFKKNSEELIRQPENVIYDRLSMAIFSSNSVKEIGQKYSQQERQDFKLLIVKLVEDSRKLALTQKRNDTVKRRGVLILAGVMFLSVLLLIIVKLQNRKFEEVKKQVLAVEIQNERQEPIRLTIPSIGVDAVIESVGVTPSGDMQAPGNTANVGWYNLGPKPGEAGSAVIDGHFNGEDGRPAVFANLDKLKQGDKLYVYYGNGKVVTFVVRERREYVPGYAEDVFFSEGGIHLNLVTCDGVWDKVKKSYSKRLVVFTEIRY